MSESLQRWCWRVGALLLLGLVLYLLVGTYSSILRTALHFDLGSSAQAQPDSNVPLPGRAVPILDSPHVPYTGADHPPYDSVPPTSGPHVPWTVAPGVYEEGISEELQVHALEHGHILVQYSAATSRSTVAQLELFARHNTRNVIVAPYSKLRRGIALTAWGRIELLSRPDEARMQRFVDRLAGRYNHGWQKP